MRRTSGDFSSDSFRFVFFRELVNDRGARYRVSIESVEIAGARSRDRALEAAQRRFARHHHVSSWKHLADGYEEYKLHHPWGREAYQEGAQEK
jgi:hypothetical protein